MMGLLIDVYRSAAIGDCTNSGVSSKHDTLCVVNVDGPFVPSAEHPAVALIDGPRGTKNIVRVLNCADEGEEPEWQMVTPDGYVGPMAGGNYAGSSDGRWTRAVGFYGAVSIHDRYETNAQYASYD